MEQGRALAGFVLGGLLFALALPGSPPAGYLCRNPTEVAAVEGHTIAVRCDAAAEQAGSVRGPARQLFGFPIDLNCADAQTLEILAGIGKVRAQAILDERRIRPFSRVDDLRRVRGIGPKTLEQLRRVVGVNSDPSGSASAEFQDCRSNGEPPFRPTSGGRG
jgi:competence protein ComEA